MGYASFAVASATDGQAAIAGPEIGVGIRRCIPEQGEGVREISGEGQSVDTCVGGSSRPDGANEPTRANHCSISQGELPVLISCTAMDLLISIDVSLSGQHYALSSRLPGQVGQKCERVNASLV